MVKNDVKAALRNIKRHKGFSLINMAGLAIAIACSILVFLFVSYELSYDKYHEKADRIYRLAINASLADIKIRQTQSSAVTFKTLLEEFPDIENGVKILKLGTRPVTLDNLTFYEPRMFAADSTFFDVFTCPLIHGIAEKALAEPNTMVLSENMALKYFGRTDVVGKMLTVQFPDTAVLTITGVFQNVPNNSHFKFDFLISSISFPDAVHSKSWSDNCFVSYIVFQENTAEERILDISEKLKGLNRKYHGVFGNDGPIVEGNYWEFFLQPITSIHLNSDLSGEFETNGNEEYVYMFLAIGIIILLIACVNFMNLTTAKASLRAKEVGIRKVVGSSRKKLIIQFLTESTLLSLIALGLAISIVELFLPSFRILVGRPVDIQYFNSIIIIPALLLFGIIVGIISGSYPAFVLSSFKPVAILKTTASDRKSSIWIRNALIIFQFSASIFLIISSLTISRQLKFIQNKNLGFDKEQVLVIRNPLAIKDNINAFKETLKSHRDIINVSGSRAVPGQNFSDLGFKVEDSDKWFTLNFSTCDYDFLETLKLEMAKGRFFSREFAADSNAIVLNQSACEILGWDDPIGKRVSDGWNYGTYTVIGVVKDLHFESLHYGVRPMAFLFSGGPYVSSERNISVRMNIENVDETIDYIGSTWNQFAPGMPFQYSFLNEDYDNLYLNDKRTREFSTILCTLAVFISCIGLFGLASFVAGQKSKEIGIRRVLGASISGIVGRLNINFVRWVVISNIIAWPIAWLVMTRWLQNYAYRINLDLEIFLTAGIMAIIIALVTVSWQSVKAAMANPVNALRNE